MTASPPPSRVNHSPVLCIDLGGTVVRGGYHDKDGEIRLLEFENGSNVMDSVVAFTPGGRIIGNGARDYILQDPSNVVIESKRLLGREVDVIVKHQNQLHPYNIRNVNGKPVVCVKEEGAQKMFKPEEISAMILGKMKKLAEGQLGCPIYDCLITVPIYFDTAQRHATMEAAKLAKMNLIQLLNDPVAAAIYLSSFMTDFTTKRYVLVADVGGSTTDLCIVNMSKNRHGTITFDVQKTFGSNFSGGNEMHEVFVDIMKDKCEKLGHPFTDEDKDAVNKICKIAEQIKFDLTKKEQVDVFIKDLLPGFDFNGFITRDEFDQHNVDVYNEVMRCVNVILRDFNVKSRTITDVLISGGASRVPTLQNKLQNYFHSVKVWTLSSQEDVIRGACMFTAYMDGVDRYSKFFLNDCIPFDVGIQSIDGLMITLAERNSQFPIKRFIRIKVPQPGATEYTAMFLEGNAEQAWHNKLLGCVKIDNLILSKDSHARVEVFLNTQHSTERIQVAVRDANNSKNSLEPVPLKRNVSHSTINVDKCRVKVAMKGFTTKKEYVKEFLASRDRFQKFLTECEEQLLQMYCTRPDFLKKRYQFLNLVEEARAMLFSHLCRYLTPRDFTDNTLSLSEIFSQAMSAAGPMNADAKMNFPSFNSYPILGKVVEKEEDCGSEISPDENQEDILEVGYNVVEIKEDDED